MKIKRPILILILCLVQFSVHSKPFAPVDKWEEPRMYHQSFDESFKKRIQFGKGNLPAKLLKPVYSPNKAYWYGLIRADYMKQEQWNTSIYINRQINNPIQISLIDHNNSEIKVDWVNEKVLYIEVWWVRIVGTYLIYDVEKEIILAREMIKDGRIEFEQYKKSSK